MNFSPGHFFILSGASIHSLLIDWCVNVYCRIYEVTHDRAGRNAKELTVKKNEILEVSSLFAYLQLLYFLISSGLEFMYSKIEKAYCRRCFWAHLCFELNLCHSFISKELILIHSNTQTFLSRFRRLSWEEILDIHSLSLSRTGSRWLQKLVEITKFKGRDGPLSLHNITTIFRNLWSGTSKLNCWRQHFCQDTRQIGKKTLSWFFGLLALFFFIQWLFHYF